MPTFRFLATAGRHAWDHRRRLLRVTAIGGGSLCAICTAVLLICWQLFPFPVDRLGKLAVSPQVTDRSGRPILSLVGRDDQWRFPVALSEVSPWLVEATIAVEDQRFHSHHGVDPWAVVRAMGQNVRAARKYSGASTLTMQVCRMLDRRPRTWTAKLVESFRAIQLEGVWDKQRILEAYLNTAPYGGNVRGAEAASRRYFGKSVSDLSLGEAALLAGLPKSPTRYRPDRDPDAARARRDTVLSRMVETGRISDEQRALAAAEPLVVRRDKRPVIALHAAWLALQRRPLGSRTAIDADIQREAEQAAAETIRKLPSGSNIAVVVLDVASSEIVALVGSGNVLDPRYGQVNGATAKRSPGSALKPFIYAAAFEAGRLNEASTVYDVPIERGGWSPENFGRSFAGELSAGEALRRSLNVPAILVAEGLGLPRCIGVLEAAGVNLPRDVQSRGGLAVVVGSIEVSLLDLVNGYATLARGGVRTSPRLFLDEPIETAQALRPDVCAALDDILSSRRRMPAGMEHLQPQSVPWFMWKTGTSSGRRDAWAVGHNHRYAIGVWVGRFEGGGDVEFLGAEAAEPALSVLFTRPMLRGPADPPAAPQLLVSRPLDPPAELGGPLRVTSPSDGTEFLALAGHAIVRPRANRASGLQWFVNGLLSSRGLAEPLVLRTGSYELRCVDATGEASAVRIVVR